MAGEGGGGLSTAAIERMLAHGARNWHQPAELAAARAELAALVGRVAALESALVDLGCAASRVAVLIPRVRRNDYDEAWARLDGALIAALPPYDAGPGAAGARDEAAGLAAALDAVLATCDWVRDEGVGVGVPLGLLRRLRRALDAPRAGGAGEGEG